ncbi:MAG: IS110 family transposase, partial [Solirubrobacteraceae bacterium]
MLDALCRGTTDPVVLAELAKGRMRAKIPALREALEGRFDELHALLIGAILAHLDFLDVQIETLSGAIEVKLAPFAAAVDLLRTIPGFETCTAENANRLHKALEDTGIKLDCVATDILGVSRAGARRSVPCGSGAPHGSRRGCRLRQ